MTLRQYNDKYWFFRLTHDYRELPTLIGTINDSYREQISLASDTRYFVLRKLSMYRDLKKALVDKQYEITVTIEKMWGTDSDFAYRWVRFLQLKNATFPAKYGNHQFVNWHRWLYHGDPLLMNTRSDRRTPVEMTSELKGLVKEFYDQYQAGRVVSRKTVKLPITYILDSLKHTFDVENQLHGDKLYLFGGTYSEAVLGVAVYQERRLYTRNKAANRKLPRVVRPRLQASDSKKNFLKYLMTAMFPTNLVRVRKKKTAAKRTVFFFDAPEGSTDYFYFDIDDTTSCKVLRNPQTTHLIPNFMLTEGVYKKCAGTGMYFRDQPRSILVNSPENRAEVEAVIRVKEHSNYLPVPNYSTDLNYRKNVLLHFGSTPFVPYQAPQVVAETTNQRLVPMPNLYEDTLTYENHMQAYLNSSFNGARPPQPNNTNSERIYLINNYTELTPGGSRFWKIVGVKIYMNNTMQLGGFPNINGTRGDSTDKIKFLRDRASASSDYICFSADFMNSINPIYSFSSYFNELPLSSRDASRSDRPTSYGGRSEVGPGVIRNYTYNPMDSYPGLRVSPREKPSIQKFNVNRLSLIRPGIREKSGSFDRTRNVDTTLYMGVELEVTPNRNAFEFVQSKVIPGTFNVYLGTSFSANVVERFLYKKQMGVIKADGSTNYGFEIVTVPGTLEWHKDVWEGFFKEDYNPITEHLAPSSWLAGWINNHLTLRRAPWEPVTIDAPHVTPMCGIHVHVSKAALSPLQLGKMLTFINDPNNQGFVHRVAGRAANTYSNFAAKKVTYGYQLDPNLADAMANRGVDVNLGREERYSALNIQTGKPTVEFRIFRSNVAKAGFMKNLEFVHALCTWCRDVSLRDLNVDNFLSFVEANKGKYTWFYRWCVEKDYFKTKHTFNPLKSFITEEAVPA